MFEKRQSKRLEEENEITIKVVSTDKLPQNQKIIYHISKDISSTGARIRSNVFLPIDTLLKIELTLKNPPRMISAVGKVKWIRSLYSDETYEAGLAFNDTSRETIKLLADHVLETSGS